MLEWLQNPYVAIAVAVGAMFFGYFFGLFEGRGQGYKRRQEEEAGKAEKDEPGVQAEPLPASSPVLPPDETPLLDVSQDGAGQLHLTLDGQRVESAALEPEQRKRIIAVLTQIRPWLEAPANAPQPAGPQDVQSVPVRPAPVPATRPEPASRPAPPPAKEGEEPSAAPGSIVAQIDSILQTQLVGTPLMEKGIRLLESPEGGVIVLVGLRKFEAIDDVPDDQIKAAIRTAITTWENKYTPGL
jgi:hypothetical protein